MTVSVIKEGTMQYIVAGGRVGEQVLIDNGYYPTVRVNSDSLRKDTFHPNFYAARTTVIFQNTKSDQIVGAMEVEDKIRFMKVLFKQPLKDYLRSLSPIDLPYIFSSAGETEDGEKVIRFNVPIYESKVVSKLVDRKMKAGLGIKPSQEYHYECRNGNHDRYMIFKDVGDYAHFLFTFSDFISPAGWEKPVKTKR